MANKLEQLKTMTVVVADTGDLDAIAKFHPIDATTNPSLLLKAAELPGYAPLCDAAWTHAQVHKGDSQQQLDGACDRLAVLIGREISGIIPGRVSTEVDARLSFDRKATIARANHLIAAYEELGVSQDRILIKIAATWEGIAAAAELERAGVNCNLTLLFGFEQARACADAGVFLISPFVGRIFDWYTKTTGEAYSAETDPGVVSVRKIYDYYKSNGYDTVIMGASFRNLGQIEALAGCDRLTISPNLLAELEASDAPLSRQLGNTSSTTAVTTPTKVAIDEIEFRWQHNNNAMATEKLAEGIRAFAADQIKLEARLSLLG